MNYGNILTYDIANGLGCRTTLFVSGCRHHCKNCFNPETWSFDYGQPYTNDTQNFILNSLSADYINGLTILGGEPMEPENQPHILTLVKNVRHLYPQKTIWIYSGYTWEELTGQKSCAARTDITDDILNNIDILVDGEFQQDNYDIRLNYRGSSNQRIIDVQSSDKTSAPACLDI